MYGNRERVRDLYIHMSRNRGDAGSLTEYTGRQAPWVRTKSSRYFIFQEREQDHFQSVKVPSVLYIITCDALKSIVDTR